MQYVSTRNRNLTVNAAEAIVSGISREGGLFAPLRTPGFSLEEASALVSMPYAERAAFVMQPWLDVFNQETLKAMCEKAYARFDDPAVAPVVPLSGNRHLLELFHGPTLAFKDVALQLLPHLLTGSAALTGEDKKILILVATSGDTGKAALEGFRDVDGVGVTVFYPDGGVSRAQYLQMATQEGKNLRVVAVKGNFDDCQAGVKKIFTDPAAQKELGEAGWRLSSANSINLGRLVPQIAYYASAYAELVGRGDVRIGDAIDVCVPTGNFGNILAALYAKRMGVPIRRFVCASNDNNVLSDFIRSGVYDRNRDFHLTSSPSMDVLVSSNLERLLFELSGQDDGQVRAWMKDLAETGRYRLTGEPLDRLQSLFWGGWADEGEVAREIARAFGDEHYLPDPHTAVGLSVARKYREEAGADTPLLIAATASPYKFSRAVLGALGGRTEDLDEFACCRRLSEWAGQEPPKAILDLEKKTIRHKTLVSPDGMYASILPLVQGA